MYLRWAKEVDLLVVWGVTLFGSLNAVAVEADTVGTLAQQTGLVATPAAPTGARGMVELGPATLSLEIEKLPPGLYQLGVIKKADGAWVPVGVIAISNPTRGPEQRAGEDRNEHSLAHQADVLKIRSQADLPPGLSASDISQVMVSDLGGTVLLQTASPSQPASR